MGMETSVLKRLRANITSARIPSKVASADAVNAEYLSHLMIQFMH
jgi:hypothetical protein